MNIGQYYATIRPWRFGQYVGRARSITKSRLKRAFPTSARLLLDGLHPLGLVPKPFQAEPVWLQPSNTEACLRMAREISEGTFTFCEHSEHFDGPVGWNRQPPSFLWNIELHAFDWLKDFDAAARLGDQGAAGCARNLMMNWVARCKYPHTPGWHPEIISRRVLNWIRFLVQHPSGNDGPLYDSISQQVTCLDRNIESYLPGTQLMENGAALVAAGSYFSNVGRPDHWLSKGMRILRKTISEQVLPGGGHIQRTPMYQCTLIEDLLSVWNLLAGRSMQPEWLRQAIVRMSQRLLDILHPDGDIPLLNDSAFDYAARPADIFDYLERTLNFTPRKRPPTIQAGGPDRSGEDDGYCVFSDSRCFLIIDGGPLGPEYLPSHGHADTLTYELSMDGRRVIVDSGVHSYQPDPVRAWCRGSAAHNTVMVDEQDQSEMWRTFRVGHRAHPFDPAVADGPGISTFIGGHDGYRSLRRGGVIHCRTLLHVHERFYVVCDHLTGKGRHRLESHVHLAPGLEPEQRDSEGNPCVVVNGPDGPVLRIVTYGCQHPVFSRNWHCPRFGEKQLHYIITLVLRDAELPCRFGYFLIPGNVAAAATCAFEDTHSYFRVTYPGGPAVAVRGRAGRYGLGLA